MFFVTVILIHTFNVCTIWSVLVFFHDWFVYYIILTPHRILPTLWYPEFEQQPLLWAGGNQIATVPVLRRILRVPNLYLEVSRTLQEPRKSFDFRLHKRTSTVTNGLTALRHTFLLFQLDKRGTTFPKKSMFLYFMFACSLESTQTHNSFCPSLRRLSMQSHKEGSKSERVPVCLYSLTASQNPRQLRLSKIVDTIPSVVLQTLEWTNLNDLRVSEWSPSNAHKMHKKIDSKRFPLQSDLPSQHLHRAFHIALAWYRHRCSAVRHNRMIAHLGIPLAHALLVSVDEQPNCCDHGLSPNPRIGAPALSRSLGHGDQDQRPSSKPAAPHPGIPATYRQQRLPSLLTETVHPEEGEVHWNSDYPQKADTAWASRPPPLQQRLHWSWALVQRELVQQVETRPSKLRCLLTSSPSASRHPSSVSSIRCCIVDSMSSETGRNSWGDLTLKTANINNIRQGKPALVKGDTGHGYYILLISSLSTCG